MKEANLAIRFLLELCLLAALAYAGLQVNVVLAIAAPLVAAVVWGLFVSPKARFSLSRPLWVGVQVVLFGAAVAGLVASGQRVLGASFGVAVAVNLVLVLIWSETGTVAARA
jgi:cytochrome b